MADPSLFDAIRIPTDVLIALDNRDLHFQMQPYHYLVRLVHVVAMAAFFGAIGLLDLRLLGWRASVPLRAFADHTLPWLFATFALALLTGAALFAYDPVHVGAHAYFMPKMLLIVLGVANAGVFHRTAYLRSLAKEGAPPLAAKLAGGLSLAIWAAVIVCSSLNVEGVPKVFLR